MGNPLAELCALLREIEEPDRFNRPHDHDVSVERERFEAMVGRLDTDFGPVTTARAPDGEFPGWVSLAGPPLELIVSKFGRTVSSTAPIAPQPDDVSELRGWLAEDAWGIPGPIRDILVHDLRFGVVGGLKGIDTPAPGAETHKPLDARTPNQLREQILALPTSPPELGALREWLCRELSIALTDGPSRSSEYPEHSLLVEAERLQAVLRADREGPEARRWLVVDDEIVTSDVKLRPIHAVRHVFGVGLHEAQDLLFERRSTLATIRPYASAFL